MNQAEPTRESIRTGARKRPLVGVVSIAHRLAYIRNLFLDLAPSSRDVGDESPVKYIGCYSYVSCTYVQPSARFSD